MKNLLRGSIVTLGAFALGAMFEKKSGLHAERVASNRGDVLDVYNKSIETGGHPLSVLSRHGYPSMDSLHHHGNFVISYNRRHRVANWVLEYITAEQLRNDHAKLDRSGMDFFEDKSLHHYFRATKEDYQKSGYDRGHLAAAGNYRTDAAHTKQTYVLSNIAPQVGRGFNRDKWNELERHCRSRIRQVGGAWLCTGPLYLAHRQPDGKMVVSYEVIGPRQVAVPTHFFKLVLYEVNHKHHLECYLLPNAAIEKGRKLDEFRIDPEVIERAAGLIFFNQIPRRSMVINANHQ